MPALPPPRCPQSISHLRAGLPELDVSRETSDLLVRFEELVRAENERQNLVAASTLDDFATRHVDDALQLVDLGGRTGSWCDIGSGAGLPGMVIAIVTKAPVTLVEPRRLRADFLRRTSEELGLTNVSVIASKAQNAAGSFDIVTARAVAALGDLFAMTMHLAHSGTRWILPKGRNAKNELEAARQTWQGRFSLVPSRTSEEAMIIVADQVGRRGKR